MKEVTRSISEAIDEEEIANNSMNRRKRRVLIQTSLYAEDCVTHLQQALEISGAPEGVPSSTAPKSRYASSSDEDEQDGESDGGIHSDGSSSDEAGEASSLPSASETAHQGEVAIKKSASKPPPRGKAKLESLLKRQTDVRVRKYVDLLTCHNFPLREPDQSDLCLPTSLLDKDDRLADHPSISLRTFQTLVGDLMSGKPVVVFFLRSGRFAGAVFEQGECKHHRTTTRYTVRKGQGKAQSAQDSSRRPKSIGSQLRRAGEEKLREDIAEAAREWNAYVNRACLILLSCPKTMKKSFFDSLEGILTRDDGRIRRVPLDLGRPTFESAVLIHDVLTTVTIRERNVVVDGAVVDDAEPVGDNATKNGEADPTSDNLKVPEEVEEIPLSALHVACKNGDLEVIRDILATNTEDVNMVAGPDLMTPLHYAAAASTIVEPSRAADCVLELLTSGKADPTLMDSRTRPPYFLASHERTRDAFRIARSRLGENYCNWEDGKVGPPLAAEDLQKRKEKEAEKRRKKKARQKEKKSKENVHAEEMEEKKRGEEETQRQENEAKRVRDGLKPKATTASNVCDFCQTSCKGRKRNQMFKRLEYAYCSTDCVQKHKRELMANAALSRFGS
jgi:hypothetical protein